MITGLNMIRNNTGFLEEEKMAIRSDERKFIQKIPKE